MSVSIRAKKALTVSCPMFDCFSEAKDKLNEPGFINLGVAHNDLLQNMISDKLKKCVEIKEEDFNYGLPMGSVKLRVLVADFLNRHFVPYYPLKEHHIFVETGAGASIYQLIMNISDIGDYCMIPVPYYGAFDLDVGVHTGVRILEAHVHDPYTMRVDEEELKIIYQEAINAGKKMTSILITNPSNPSGRCYSRKDLDVFLKFASTHQLHVIFDEIYALSSYSHFVDASKPDPFVSILSIDYETVIDPSLVHVIYGMSKDFAMNGFRIGFIIDQFNEPLKTSLMCSAHFSYISSLTDRMLCNFFSDETWVDKYIVANRKELAVTYEKTTGFLRKNGIEFIPGEAGHFFMINTRSFLNKKDVTLDDEKRIWRNMINRGVYVVPGYAFHTHMSGYFRLTFALPWDILKLGLERMVKGLKDE
ncbi:pyridoxal phosphate-dependent transferase [Gilbertella persicaria]|uniref:pyridoxal phosphate-dependent transferase n=1 Tax=Gilbertella persicaria TaxID=101096 RepID=UPI002221095B|nr:pyridoxal phosphate-dependent transferase [Gilbertella persicaria]KAI8064319.1 pyridoxal phosphate-dependent transferase [Gilbertella persicaria]